MAEKSIFLSVGDESGDLHASNLMRAIRSMDGGVAFLGFGMAGMKAEGLEQLADGDERGGAMWLHNALRLGEFWRRLALCKEVFRARRPDLVALVDFGGFNLYVARAAAAAGIPVLYYILPQLWAHGLYRIKKIKKWVTRSLVIYPFEPELYRRFGLEAQYVGHPLFDELDRRPPDQERVQHVRRTVGERVVALFPGSRRQEVRANLPLMLQTCARINKELPDVAFASVLPDAVRPFAREMLERSECDVALPDVRPVEMAQAACLCITKSGTITLEIASQLCPMTIVYRVGPFVYFLAKGVAQTRYMGLVNVLAGRMISPEKPMWRPGVSWLTGHSLALLRDETLYDRSRRELRALMDDFAWPGASERAARVALEMVGRSGGGD
jgi:lipid-A-disaccharide synthase